MIRVQRKARIRSAVATALISGDPGGADLVHFGTLAIRLIGAFIARF